MTDGPKPWYDLREYAAMTGQTLNAVRHQVKRGTLKTSRYGGRHGKHVVLLATLITDHADLYASLVAAMNLRRHRTPQK